jgi:DNA-directed RNA polymerase specialized sigma24 family protein
MTVALGKFPSRSSVATAAASLLVMNPIMRPARPQASDSRDAPGSRDASAIMSALYAEHALSLTRLARVMLGDQGAAQDAVHDAFCGLCRRWSKLTDPDLASAYLRAAVLNRCRDVLRRQARRPAAVVLRPELLGKDVRDTEFAGADAPLLALEDRR